MAALTGGLIAAGIGAAGAIGAASMSSSAAGKAADAQAAASREATQFQRDALQQQRVDSAPWMFAGQSALYSLMDNMGLSRPVSPTFYDPNSGPIGSGYAGGNNLSGAVSTLNPLNSLAQILGGGQQQAAPQGPQEMTRGLGFTQTPGYQFQVQQANDAVQNRLAALGLAGSGDAMKALATTTNGLASQEYGNYLNRLAAMAGMGQTATGQSNAATQNAANNLSNIAIGAGNNRASSILGQSQAWGNAFGQITSPTGPVMNALSGIGGWNGSSGWGSNLTPNTGYGLMSGIG